MTEADIEAMARAAGGEFHVDRAWLTRFAALVAAKARDEAAVIVDEAAAEFDGSGGDKSDLWIRPMLEELAAAIRAAQKEAS